MGKGNGPARSGRKRPGRGGDPRIVQARSTAAAGDTLARCATQRLPVPRCSAAARRARSWPAIGTRNRCSCGRQCRHSRDCSRARNSSHWRGATTSSRASSFERQRASPLRTARFGGSARATKARLDAAGTRRQPARRRRRRAAAPVLVPALRPPRRPDGELRRAGWRRGAAFRFLRRIPAAGIRAAPLALRTPGRSGASARPARQDPAPLCADARRDACSRRPAVPSARLRPRRRCRRRMHDVLDRVSRQLEHRARPGFPGLPARPRRSSGALCRPGSQNSRGSPRASATPCSGTPPRRWPWSAGIAR